MLRLLLGQPGSVVALTGSSVAETIAVTTHLFNATANAAISAVARRLRRRPPVCSRSASSTSRGRSRAAGKGKPSEREKSLPPLEVSNAKVLELLQLVEDQQAALKTHKRSFGDVPFATDFGYEALKGALELL